MWLWRTQPALFSALCNAVNQADYSSGSQCRCNPALAVDSHAGSRNNKCHMVIANENICPTRTWLLSLNGSEAEHRPFTTIRSARPGTTRS